MLFNNNDAGLLFSHSIEHNDETGLQSQPQRPLVLVGVLDESETLLNKRQHANGRDNTVDSSPTNTYYEVLIKAKLHRSDI